jgi:hypothetical protein
MTMTAKQDKPRDFIAEVRAEENQDQFGVLVSEISEVAPHLEAEVIDATREEWRPWAKSIFAKRQQAAAEERRDANFRALRAQHDAKYAAERAKIKALAQAAKPKTEDRIESVSVEEQAQEKVRKFTPQNAGAKSFLDRIPGKPAIHDRTGRIDASGWPDAPTPPEGAVGIERLTYPRGLLGHVTQYIYDTDRLPDRVMALAGALLTCSKALDRKVIGPGGIGLMLYLLLIAESGAGKQHVINCIRTLLRAMGVEDALVGTGIASVQSIDQILEGTGKEGEGSRPSALVTIDEYGSFLTRIHGQTGNVSEIPGKLQTLWGWPPEEQYLGDIKVGKSADDRLTVHGPAFSIFGASTEHSFFTALKQKNVSGGFVNRHFLLNAGRGALKPVVPKYKWLQCPEWLLKALRDVAGEPAPRDNRPLIKKINGEEVVFKDWFRRIESDSDAAKMHYDFECETRAMPSVRDREVWIRAPEIALRHATVQAAFRGTALVDAEDLAWGIELARYSTRFLMRGMDKHMLEEYAQADLVEYIREEFRHRMAAPMPGADRGVLTQGQIRKYCERKCKDHRQIDAAIYHMELCEDITELEDEGGAGRPTRRWQWARSK